MALTKKSREIIGRGTMAFVALAFAWAATAMLIGAARMSTSDVSTSILPWGPIVVIAVALYLVAITLGCFVFSALDPRRSNVGRVMTVADGVSEAFSRLCRILFRNW